MAKNKSEQPAVAEKTDKAKRVKAEKADKPKKQRFARTREMWQAYGLLKPNDPRLGLWIILGFLVGFAIGFLGFAWTSSWSLFGIIAGVVAGLLLGVLLGMVVFGVRARRTTFAQAEGRPGAAAWAMEQMRGDWRISQATAVNTQQDIVHRVIGRPGVVLVGEGNGNRLAHMIGQEKKKLSRIVGDTPIYQVIVGSEEGQVPLKKLNSHIMKLPRNIKGAQIRTLEKRLQTLTAPKMPIPKGPPPGGRGYTGKGLQVSQRQLRRRGLG